MLHGLVLCSERRGVLILQVSRWWSWYLFLWLLCWWIWRVGPVALQGPWGHLWWTQCRPARRLLCWYHWHGKWKPQQHCRVVDSCWWKITHTLQHVVLYGIIPAKDISCCRVTGRQQLKVAILTSSTIHLAGSGSQALLMLILLSPLWTCPHQANFKFCIITICFRFAVICWLTLPVHPAKMSCWLVSPDQARQPWSTTSSAPKVLTFNMCMHAHMHVCACTCTHTVRHSHRVLLLFPVAFLLV